MGYIKLFNNTSAYQDYISDEPLLPNVSLVEEDNKVYYNYDLIIISSESNPVMMERLYNAGYASNPDYMTKSEAEVVTENISDFLNTIIPKLEETDGGYGYGYGYSTDSELCTFNEFKYFINVSDESYYFPWLSVKEITIPEGITNIDFQWCNFLEKVTLPKTIEYFEHTDTDGNSDLNIDIYFKGTVPPEYIDINRSSVTIHCPSGSRGTYETAFSEHIQEWGWSVVEY